ncbi:hypothetical protein CR513_06320, partial [Mucuna pruriens]
MYQGSRCVEEYFKEMKILWNYMIILLFLHLFTKPLRLNLNLRGMKRSPTLPRAPTRRVRKGRKRNSLEETKVLRRGVHLSKATEKSIGDLLMVRRLMSVFIEDDQSQRENIFHSRCMIQGKCCSLIIDGGSNVNVASLRLVEKLCSPTIPHPKPYKL